MDEVKINRLRFWLGEIILAFSFIVSLLEISLIVWGVLVAVALFLFGMNYEQKRLCKVVK